MLVPTSPLGPSQRHIFPVPDAEPVRWLRLSILPDGGVARLRAYGAVFADAAPTADDAELSALKHGGRIVGFSDAHYGEPWVILTEGRGHDMGDGWETRRRRQPGHDWIIVALGRPGTIERIEIDTAHFKGNFPDKVSLQACRMGPGTDQSIICQSMFWPDLMAPQPARADAIHAFGADHLAELGPVTHVRLNIHPDGGVSRFRAFGRPSS
jgi:allantoicase